MAGGLKGAQFGLGVARNPHMAQVFKNVNLQPNIKYISTPKTIRDGYQYYTKAKMDSLRKAGYKKNFISLMFLIKRIFFYLFK